MGRSARRLLQIAGERKNGGLGYGASKVQSKWENFTHTHLKIHKVWCVDCRLGEEGEMVGDDPQISD